MPPKDPINWMLSDAIETLARAERLHQQFFNLQPLAGTREPSWEPPIDVLETEREILIFIALPGVDPDEVEAVLEKGTAHHQRTPHVARRAARCPHPPPRTAARPVRASHCFADRPLCHQPLRRAWLRRPAPRQIQLRRWPCHRQCSTRIEPRSCRRR